MRLLTLASIVLSALSSGALAQDYPEYEGVYVKMVDGSFIEIPSAGHYDGGAVSDVRVLRAPPRAGPYPSQFTLYFENAIRRIPAIDFEKIESIVINSRRFSFEFGNFFLDALTKLEYSHEGNGLESLYVLASEIGTERLERSGMDDPPRRVPLSDLPYTLARNYCGMLRRSLDIRNVNQFIVEIDVTTDQLKAVSYSEPFGRCDDSLITLLSFGLTLVTKSTEYPFISKDSAERIIESLDSGS